MHDGRILIDGQDISRVTQESLRDAIGVVPQDISLFHRSVMENIRYGRPAASDRDVHEAACAARCDFIHDLPDGMRTLVGERGVKLSGDQRQRIAIARAFLKNAPLLLLDEATSALDGESEEAIREALGRLMHGRTVITIAHRLSFRTARPTSWCDARGFTGSSCNARWIVSPVKRRPRTNRCPVDSV